VPPPSSIATDSPLLCYVTGRKAFGADPGASVELLASIRRAIEAGVDWIQIREKDLAARELMRLAGEAVALASGTRTRISINDRLDIALAAHAGGVHLGGESVPAAAVSSWRSSPQGVSAFSGSSALPGASLSPVFGEGGSGSRFLLGASCHSLAQSQSAERDGADYIFFGPVFATPSKERFGAPQGIERLGEVCAGVRIPVLAIGGINAETASQCLRAGAAGIAAIRLFQEVRNVDELKQLINSLRRL
jgi:thiamine-phosphate pyrophosphorylase